MALEETLNLYRPPSLDYGQVYYLVDDNFRTAAQGWSRPDRTGPLDLYEARKAGRGGTQYVFRNGDYTSDYLAAQTAIDSAIDFRGDTLFLPNGAHSWSTVVTVDVPDLKITGQTRTTRRSLGCTITDAVGSHVIAAAADRLDIGWLRFVPRTAVPFWAAAAGADNMYWHDIVYDSTGVATSTSTVFLTTAGTTDSTWERFTSITDIQQGAFMNITGASVRIAHRDFELWHSGAVTLATALATVTAAQTVNGWIVDRGEFNLSGLASTAVTNLIVATESGSDIMSLRITNCRGHVGFCAAGGLVSLGTAETAEIGFYNNYLATISAGTGLGTVYTA